MEKIKRHKIEISDINFIKENYLKYGEIKTNKPINKKLDKNNYNTEIFNSNFETFFCDQNNIELNKIISKYIKIENNEFIHSMHHNKYKPGNFIKKHTDGTGIGQYRTFTILLNEEFEGGDFYIDDVKIPINYGEMIEFDGRNLHHTTPIISGEREVFVIILHPLKKEAKTIL